MTDHQTPNKAAGTKRQRRRVAGSLRFVPSGAKLTPDETLALLDWAISKRAALQVFAPGKPQRR